MKPKFRIQLNKRQGRYRVQFKSGWFWFTHGYDIRGWDGDITWEPYWYSTEENAMAALIDLKNKMVSDEVQYRLSNRWQTVKEVA